MKERVSQRTAILALAVSGIDVRAIAILIDCHICTVRRWADRGTQDGNVFTDRPRFGRPALYTKETQLKIVAFYCQYQPLPGCSRWTLRWAALYLKAHWEQIEAAPSKSTIHRILESNKLKPHQSRYFLHISDPQFFPKMEHLLRLYADPPRYLFFFDECPGIQVLKRLTPDLQTEQMKLRLEEFEYIRNGTIDVFAFLNHSDGTVHAECHGNHKTDMFIDVFRRHVSQFPQAEQLHYVMDNLSTHVSYSFCQAVAQLSNVPCPDEMQLGTQIKRAEWLTSDTKRIVVHFTPYHGSWLNLVEIWFGIMGSKVLNNSFGSPEALKAAFDAFVEQWNSLLAHPFNWSYDGKGLHNLAVKRFAKMMRNSADQLDLRFLTKSLMLMTNLLNHYLGEVSEESWQQLAEAVSLHWGNITTIIRFEKGPKRKKKAQQALNTFMATLNQYFPQYKTNTV